MKMYLLKVWVRKRQPSLVQIRASLTLNQSRAISEQETEITEFPTRELDHVGRMRGRSCGSRYYQ